MVFGTVQVCLNYAWGVVICTDAVVFNFYIPQWSSMHVYYFCFRNSMIVLAPLASPPCLKKSGRNG